VYQLDLHIHGRNLEITDKTREHVESKLSQIDRRLPGISQAMVELALEDTRSHNDQIVAQVTLHVGRTLLRAQQRAGNAKTAVNSVAKALDQQIERFKSHSYRSERRTQAGWGNSDEVDTTGPDSGGPGGVMDDGPVVRLKEFAMEPTSVNEAAAQMRFLGHDFFMFLDSESDKHSVLYLRGDGNYGMIQPR
jgi:putative sigma-54 modulation protein